MDNYWIDKTEERLDLIESEIHKLKELISSETKQVKIKREESPREFLLKYNAKNDVERTLVTISYLEEKGVKEISIDEIRKVLIEMREKSNFNISDKLQQLDKRGFLLQNGQKEKKKLWLITNNGLKFMEELKKDGRK
jgi:hypothetical protein